MIETAKEISEINFILSKTFISHRIHVYRGDEIRSTRETLLDTRGWHSNLTMLILFRVTP